MEKPYWAISMIIFILLFGIFFFIWVILYILPFFYNSFPIGFVETYYPLKQYDQGELFILLLKYIFLNIIFILWVVFGIIFGILYIIAIKKNLITKDTE